MTKQRKGSDRSKNDDLAVEQLFRSNVANIVPVELEKEMCSSFIDYAMSVITERALPDVRDGLKPVHRRILYSMLTQGFTPDKPYRKCATTVGDVLGRFHPHGDAAVYDTMVRLAQDFSMRYPLVDGHGNFGSRDGDPPAAYRYTEARLERLAVEMMSDINKDTVDFRPNFDEHEMEPTVLPSHFPNLLVSGSIGIAVGMSTNIPPHNLGETIDASIMLLQNPESTIEDLMSCLPGPDFPTGGTILGTSGIYSAYKTGRGRIVVRATAEIEELTDGSFRIVVSDLPYMVNKSKLIRDIAEQHKDKKLDGISFVRDESDRNEPVRIVIGIKRSANANVVLNQLFRKTSLQDSFSANMLALVPDQGQLVPRVLNLKDALTYFNDHQKEVITRRTQFDLERTEQRKHIVEGLRIAIDNISEVIRIIRSSATEKEAKAALSERFGFSERQSQHIVDMRLGRLTHLEQDKLEKEYQDLLERIAYYTGILSDENKLIEVIVEEMSTLRKRFADERRTGIDPYAEEISDESLIPEKQIVITMTNIGYVKRMPVSSYSMQHRGGRGISGLNMREDDMIKQIVTASTHDWLLFFTNKGRVFRLKGYRIPEESRQARGLPVVNLLRLNPDESVQTIIPLSPDHNAGHLLFATERGLVKRTAITEFKNINRAGLIAISLRENDNLVSVEFTEGDDEVMLVTEQGYSIRFAETDCRDQGRDTIGVKGISLMPEDRVISLVKVAKVTASTEDSMPAGELNDDSSAPDLDADDELALIKKDEAHKSILFVSAKGYGKRTEFIDFRPQNRGGKGLIAYKPNKKTGVLVGALSVHEREDVLLINDEGLIIRIAATEISKLGRMAIGVKLMRFRGSEIVDVAIVPHEQTSATTSIAEDKVEDEKSDSQLTWSEEDLGKEETEVVNDVTQDNSDSVIEPDMQ